MFDISSLFSSEGEIRLVLAVACLLCALGIAGAIKKKNEENKKSHEIIILLTPLIAPSLTLIFLLVSATVIQHLSANLMILSSLAQIAFVWLILEVIHVITGSRFAMWAIAVFLIPATLLNIFGLLDQVIYYLDAFAFSLGDFRISAYTMLKLTIVLTILFWITSSVSRGLETYLKTKSHLNKSTKELLLKSIKAVFYFLVFLAGMDIVGFDLTALAVFGGAAGIGIGFGLQKISSNFISGIILIMEKSIEIDDLIELSDGTYGFVRKTGARYTLIETFDSKEIMIPNEDFITSRVINWTFTSKKGRVEINIGVAYGSDLKKAQKIILGCARKHPRCIKDPEPVCYLREFGDSSVNFLLYFWVDDVTLGRYDAQSDVMFAIWENFKKSNIKIPFPQRDIHIKEQKNG